LPKEALATIFPLGSNGVPMRTHLLPALPALILVASLPASAEMFGSDYPPCGEKPSTPEIVACIQAKTKVWDDRLNAAYRDLLKRITPDQRQPLQQAEQHWIQYRDANCKFYASGPGTISVVQTAECFRSMTEDRAKEIGKAMKLGD